jgi:hypothetical protein
MSFKEISIDEFDGKYQPIQSKHEEREQEFNNAAEALDYIRKHIDTTGYDSMLYRHLWTAIDTGEKTIFIF